DLRERRMSETLPEGVFPGDEALLGPVRPHIPATGNHGIGQLVKVTSCLGTLRGDRFLVHSQILCDPGIGQVPDFGTCPCSR
ncbi:MAG: hypothetical protein ACRDTR_00425, partial [Rubrobacter sp.]